MFVRRYACRQSEWKQRCSVTLNRLCILIISQNRFAFRRGPLAAEFYAVALKCRTMPP